MKSIENVIIFSFLSIQCFAPWGHTGRNNEFFANIFYIVIFECYVLQKSASKAAEKKFQNKLRDAGIDEDFVMTRSARATSAHSEDEDSTYNKSMLENREELTA